MSEFVSPTKGRLTFDQMFGEIVGYLDEVPGAPYRLIVGSDSQTHDELTMVTAVVIHRVGKGARYFYQRRRNRRLRTLRQRIYLEVSLSLELGARLARRLAASGHADLNIEIHLDVGQAGETRDLIREIVGIVTGSGFDARIKPQSYGASTVADRYTK